MHLPRDVEIDLGQIIIFDIFTIHGGGPNWWTEPRAGNALCFMPSTNHFDHSAAGHLGAPGLRTEADAE
jgi:hypothetical protein